MNHEEYLSKLKNLAHMESARDFLLDEEEIYSILLVAYAEALATYREDRNASFDTWLFWKVKGFLQIARRKEMQQRRYSRLMQETDASQSDDIIFNEIGFLDMKDDLNEEEFKAYEFICSIDFSDFRQKPSRTGIRNLMMKGLEYSSREADRILKGIGAKFARCCNA